MKKCPYCGADYADNVAECPIDRYPLDAPPAPPPFKSPAWLESLVVFYQSLARQKRLILIEASIAAFLILLFICTARFHYSARFLQIDELPLFRVAIGRSDRWIRPKGINYIPQIHLVEFPLCPGYRIGIQVFIRH